MEAKNDGFSDDDRIAARRAEYVKRTGLDPDTGKKVKRKDAKAMRMKNVKCGYCGERGHTRRVDSPPPPKPSKTNAKSMFRALKPLGTSPERSANAQPFLN